MKKDFTVVSHLLVILSLISSVVAAILLGYDAIWAQGARFQRNVALRKKDSTQDFIETQIAMIDGLPAVYSADEKEALKKQFMDVWGPKIERLEKQLGHWGRHPERVQIYALMGLLCIVAASILQGIVYFIGSSGTCG